MILDWYAQLKGLAFVDSIHLRELPVYELRRMLYWYNHILWICKCVEFLVEDLDNMASWQDTQTWLWGPFCSLIVYVIRDYCLKPVLREVWVCITALSKVLDLVQVLNQHQILPTVSLAKVWELLKSEW